MTRAQMKRRLDRRWLEVYLSSRWGFSVRVRT